MQQILVVLIVAIAALSAAWRLMGPVARLKLLDRLVAVGPGFLSRRAAAAARGLREGGRAAGCAGCPAATGNHKDPASR
ncbi:MAG: hypothetical protein RLZZ200_1589 [Pseudomonadota bacterium]